MTLRAGPHADSAPHRRSRRRTWSVRGAGVGAGLFLVNAVTVFVVSGAPHATVGAVVLLGLYLAGYCLAGAGVGLLLALVWRPRGQVGATAIAPKSHGS